MDSPQQVCETYPAFQNKVFEMALDPDPVMNGVALDTLGLLGSTVEGKQVLQKTGSFFFPFHFSYLIEMQMEKECVYLSQRMLMVLCSSGEQFKTVLSRMSRLAGSGATELRVRSLDAISQLLTLQVCMTTFLTSESNIRGKQFECVTFCCSQNSRQKTS